MLVMDASASMTEGFGDRRGSKMEVAQRLISRAARRWDRDGVTAGLMAYGHRSASSCNDIETLVPWGEVNARAFRRALNRMSPRGKTPLSDAMARAASQMKYRDEPATLVLLSDGQESCGRDPCETARELRRRGADFTVHVVGLKVDREAEQELRCVAEATGGRYVSANDADSLLGALDLVTLRREPEVLGTAELRLPQLAPGRYDLTITIDPSLGSAQRTVTRFEVTPRTTRPTLEPLSTPRTPDPESDDALDATTPQPMALEEDGPLPKFVPPRVKPLWLLPNAPERMRPVWLMPKTPPRIRPSWLLPKVVERPRPEWLEVDDRAEEPARDVRQTTAVRAATPEVEQLAPPPRIPERVRPLWLLPEVPPRARPTWLDDNDDATGTPVTDVPRSVPVRVPRPDWLGSDGPRAEMIELESRDVEQPFVVGLGRVSQLSADDDAFTSFEAEPNLERLPGRDEARRPADARLMAESRFVDIGADEPIPLAPVGVVGAETTFERYEAPVAEPLTRSDREREPLRLRYVNAVPERNPAREAWAVADERPRVEQLSARDVAALTRDDEPLLQDRFSWYRPVGPDADADRAKATPLDDVADIVEPTYEQAWVAPVAEPLTPAQLADVRRSDESDLLRDRFSWYRPIGPQEAEDRLTAAEPVEQPSASGTTTVTGTFLRDRFAWYAPVEGDRETSGVRQEPLPRDRTAMLDADAMGADEPMDARGAVVDRRETETRFGGSAASAGTSADNFPTEKFLDGRYAWYQAVDRDPASDTSLVQTETGEWVPTTTTPEMGDRIAMRAPSSGGSGGPDVTGGQLPGAGDALAPVPTMTDAEQRAADEADAAARLAMVPPAPRTVTGPKFARIASVKAGFTFSIAWDGRERQKDWIAVARPDDPADDYIALKATKNAGDIELRAPSTPGEYEVRYISSMDGRVMSRQSFTVTRGTVRLVSMEFVEVEDEMSVWWDGPGHTSDIVTLATAEMEDGDYLISRPIVDGNPVKMVAPNEPGEYELRYINGTESVVMHRTKLTVMKRQRVAASP